MVKKQSKYTPSHKVCDVHHKFCATSSHHTTFRCVVRRYARAAAVRRVVCDRTGVV